MIACSVMVLLALSAVAVAAQTPTPAPTTGGTFTGKVSKTSPLTVNSNGQDRQINAAPNMTVVRDGKAATVGDLKVDDQVNVTSNPDNTVSKIETTSVTKSGGSSIWKWLIPLLIVLALIGLLAYFLSRRKKDAFVLERDRNTPPRT